MNTKLDLTKPVQTRGGRAVRILCTDRKRPSDPDYCVFGLVMAEDGTEVANSWNINGETWSNETDMALINVPPPVAKRKGWLNIYPWNSTRADTGFLCKTRAEADRDESWYGHSAGVRRVACIEVEYTEGQGL